MPDSLQFCCETKESILITVKTCVALSHGSRSLRRILIWIQTYIWLHIRNYFGVCLCLGLGTDRRPYVSHVADLDL